MCVYSRAWRVLTVLFSLATVPTARYLSNTMSTPTETAIQSFALTCTRSHTIRVCVRWDDAGKHIMGDHTETWHAGEYEFLICGERAFVKGWTAAYPRATQVGAYWRATSTAEAHKLCKKLTDEGYVRCEAKTRVLGFIDYAGGSVWHSWGDGANRVGHCAAPAQIVPVIAYSRPVYDRVNHLFTKEHDRIVAMYALTPSGDNVREGDVCHDQWYDYTAAQKLVAGEWTATDPMIAVDSVNDCRRYELQVFC